VLATGPLAQTVDLTEAPTSVAAALFLVLVLMLTGMLRRGAECDSQKERADALQIALDLERERSAKLTEALDVQQELGRLLRKVLYALPQADDTPPPPPLRRRS
jgi:hypothetical protein